MGGQQTFIGVYYQSIAALLEALNDQEWKKISVECLGHDKVDIALYDDKDNLIKGIQVKERKNTITLLTCLQWLNGLAKDISGTKAIKKAFLIGTFSEELQTLNEMLKSGLTLSDFNNKHKGCFDEKVSLQMNTLLPYSDKIDIELLKIDDVEKIVIEKLKEAIVNIERMNLTDIQIKLIRNSLLVEKIVSGISGTKISRENFSNNIQQTIMQMLEFSNICIYGLDDNYNLTEKGIAYNYLELPFIKENITDLNQKISFLLEKITKITMEKLNREEIAKTNDYIEEKNGVKFYIPDPNAFKPKIVNIENDEKFNKLYLHLLEDGYKVEESIFNLGSAQIEKPIINYSCDRFIGDEKQKYKYELIIDLNEIYVEILKYRIISKLFDEYYFVPIVFQNEGNVVDSNVRLECNCISSTQTTNFDIIVKELHQIFGNKIDQYFTINNVSCISNEATEYLKKYLRGLVAYRIKDIGNKVERLLKICLQCGNIALNQISFEFKLNNIKPQEKKIGNPSMMLLPKSLIEVDFDCNLLSDKSLGKKFKIRAINTKGVSRANG